MPVRCGASKYGGIAQLVEHSVHTRSVICSSQIAATRPVGQKVKTPPFHGGNMGSIPVRVTKKETIHPDGFFFGDSYVGPNPLGSIARQFHAQAWQRYAMPLVLTCGQNKCRGDTEPTQSAEYSRTGQQLIYRVRIPQETIHPDGFFFGDSYVGPNPLGSIARQFHAQAWQRYAMPLVLTCGQNKCRGDTEPTQSAEYSRTGQQLIYRVRIPKETIHPDGFFFR